MRYIIYKEKKLLDDLCEAEITGTITENVDNKNYGDALICSYPFNYPCFVAFKIESYTSQIALDEDGNEELKKNIFNIQVYGEIAEKLSQDKDIYIGQRVRVRGPFASKNYFSTKENVQIMNICNRYKNMNGERPFIESDCKEYTDKITGEKFLMHKVDWTKLLESQSINSIPDESDVKKGKVAYYVLEDGRVLRQERRTNYFIIGKDVECTGTLDFDSTVGDTNKIHIISSAKDIYIDDKENYKTAHICLANKMENGRFSYLHTFLRDKDFAFLSGNTPEDKFEITGRIKYKELEQVVEKKKGKSFVIKTPAYEIDTKYLAYHKYFK